MFFWYYDKLVVNQVQEVLMASLICSKQWRKYDDRLTSYSDYTNKKQQLLKEFFRGDCLVLSSFLNSSDKYQVFIDLFNLSSYLIPQRFLPKFVDQCNQTTPSLSSFTLEPHREVPAVYYHRAPTMQNQSLQVSIQYSQILFFLFLFVTGWIFATFTNRFLSR